jgi:hypothetical protein
MFIVIVQLHECGMNVIVDGTSMIMRVMLEILAFLPDKKWL